MEALRVSHDDLPGGFVSFTDDELVDLERIPRQIVVEQRLQAGNFAPPIFVGDHANSDFAILFNQTFQATNQKLEQIRLIRGTFTLQPFVIEEITSYTVYWPEEPPWTERWVRGRRAAQWDKPILWREQRTVPCVTVGS